MDRFMPRALFAALDGRRSERGLSWRELAETLQLTDHTAFTRLKQGHQPLAGIAVQLCEWLDVEPKQFMERTASKSDPADEAKMQAAQQAAERRFSERDRLSAEELQALRDLLAARRRTGRQERVASAR